VHIPWMAKFCFRDDQSPRTTPSNARDNKISAAIAYVGILRIKSTSHPLCLLFAVS